MEQVAAVDQAAAGRAHSRDGRAEFGHLSDIIHETLQCFERCAGEMAYINIKYVVPTYQSCTGGSRYSQ